MKRLHIALLSFILFALFSLPDQRGQAQDGYIRSPRLGITFISSADHPADDTRYRRALMLGAGWNRWPLYWQRVETAPGSYDWRAYDRVVADDLRHGLRINAILLGIPGFHREGAVMRGLSAPVFSDGSDNPAAGKAINPNNPWATFVYATVNRYKPGGVLAQQLGINGGVRVWEAWNEPDLRMFWEGSPDEYARLLKVTYLVVHHADPEAEVMFGGLAYTNPDADDWLARVLAVYARDAQSPNYNWFMDIVAVHNYTNPWRSGYVVRRAREVLDRYGLQRPIWLNESGVPVWDDYPGPTWAGPDPSQRRLRSTQQQAANFIVQSAAYAWAAGAEVIFHHQLYDDCGNQASGTDFPPNNGDICSSGACWGDAHGLYRNERSSECFSQHPQPGSPRPAAAAFYALAQVFGNGDFTGGQVLNVGGSSGVVIEFERPSLGERIYVVWNRTLGETKIEVPASGTDASLFSITNQDWFITPQDGRYTLGLPPTTRDDYPFLAPGEVAVIGGAPYMVVERAAGADEINPALVQLAPFDPLNRPDAGSGVGGLGLPVGQQIVPTPGSILAGGVVPPGGDTLASSITDSPPLMSTPNAIARPTIEPGADSEAPVTAMQPLPIISPPTFTVSWSGRDDSGVAAYLVWVRVDDEGWYPWLENTSETQAEFTGEAGRRYDFAVWAVDLAGNWSLNTELTPQASTAVQ